MRILLSLFLMFSFSSFANTQYDFAVKPINLKRIYSSLNNNSLFFKTQNDFKYSIELNFIQLDYSSWSKNWILDELRKTADIYSQAGIYIRRANIFTGINIPSNSILLSGPPGEPMFEEMEALREARRSLVKELKHRQVNPIIIMLDLFKDSMRDGRAFTEGTLAGSMYLSGPNPKMANLNQSLISHELGHILFEEGHNYYFQNILNDGISLTEENPGNLIESSQIEKLKRSPYVKSLIIEKEKLFK